MDTANGSRDHLGMKTPPTCKCYYGVKENQYIWKPACGADTIEWKSPAWSVLTGPLFMCLVLCHR